MNIFNRKIHLGLCLSLMIISLSAKAQLPEADMYQAYDQAKGQLESFQNDSAYVILSGLLGQCADHDLLRTPFGLKVRMSQAEALEKKNRDEEAVQQLLHIAEDSKGGSQWDVYAQVQLTMARLYEKNEHKVKCYSYLKQAKQAVLRYELDSIYPRFCIRMASYHRLFGDKDSALIYAQRVVETAPDFEQYDHTATGHMLMGLLLRNQHSEQAVRHFKLAARMYSHLGNYSGYSFMMGNLSKQYLKNRALNHALAYNDSFLLIAQKAITRRQEDGTFLPYYYKGRAEIYEQVGLLDSSLHYFKKSYELKLDQLSASKQEEVAEIEARFNDVNKSLKIQQQKQQLITEASRRNYLITLIAVIILLLSGLLILYLKLRAASKKTQQQALIISQTNEELKNALDQQISLQGEIHHRVKNNLQIIISLLELQRDEIQDTIALESLDAMSNRIYSMAAIHQILYHRQGTDCISLRDYTYTLSQHFRNLSAEGSQPIFYLEIGDTCFNLQTLMPIGIILNELMTNSLKYASLPGHRLTIDIHLKTDAREYCLTYRDNGPGFVSGALTERRGGLGTYLLQSMVRQLDGRMESYNEEGAVYQIYFSEENTEQAADRTSGSRVKSKYLKEYE